MSELEIQLKKSSLALKSLLDKLETDGYIKCNNNLPLSEFVFNDLMAFSMLPVFVNLERIGKENAKSFLDRLSNCVAVAVNGKAFDEFSLQYMRRIGDGKDIFPEGFILINNFDAFAVREGGLFYQRMGVDNPGRITDYYLTLIDAINKLADSNTASFINDFFDASIRVMKEEQVEELI